MGTNNYVLHYIIGTDPPAAHSIGKIKSTVKILYYSYKYNDINTFMIVTTYCDKFKLCIPVYNLVPVSEI